MYTLTAGKSWLQLLLGLCIVSLLIAWLILQEWVGLEPCALCILDRAALIVVAAGCGLVLFLRNLVARLMGLIAIVGGLSIGLASTIRHVWLEHFPGSASCLFPSQDGGWLAFTLDAFAGTSDCSQVSFAIMGVSLAEMTLILMILLTVCALLAGIFYLKQPRLRA